MAAGFYALAFSAYALINEGRRDCERLRDLQIEMRKNHGFTDDSVALLGHLALVAEGANKIGCGLFSDKELDRLYTLILSKQTHLLPTYGYRVWPADNEVALAALAIASARDSHYQKAKEALQASLDSLGLVPPSRVAPDTLDGDDTPRGCALSWTIAMRGIHDPARARRMYAAYRTRFWTSLVVVSGFREYQRGHERGADWDSGPIVMGIGAAASAFGIGAARIAGATSDVRALERSQDLAMSVLGTGKEAKLAKAIKAFSATLKKPWISSPPSPNAM